LHKSKFLMKKKKNENIGCGGNKCKGKKGGDTNRNQMEGDGNVIGEIGAEKHIGSFVPNAGVDAPGQGGRQRKWQGSGNPMEGAIGKDWPKGSNVGREEGKCGQCTLQRCADGSGAGGKGMGKVGNSMSKTKTHRIEL
jgi:hypothetical protein